MKKIAILMFMLFGGCSYIPPRVEMLYTDTENNPVYSIECSNKYGLGYCYKKVNQTCQNGFDIMEKSDSISGNSKDYISTKYIIIFRCK